MPKRLGSRPGVQEGAVPREHESAAVSRQESEPLVILTPEEIKHGLAKEVVEGLSSEAAARQGALERLGKLKSIFDQKQKGEALREQMAAIHAATYVTPEEAINDIANRISDLVNATFESRRAFDRAVRIASFLDNGFTPLNEALAYGTFGHVAHIHLAHIGSLKFTEQRALVMEGMRNFAEVLKQHPELDTVTAMSWMVAKQPNLFKLLGFEHKGRIDEETRQRYFKDEKRPVDLATASSTAIIEKFGKK